MSYLVKLQQTRSTDLGQAGDKAAYLGELMHAGFKAAPGVCVNASAYAETIARTYNQRIIARLASIEIDDPVELESTAEEIRSWIENAALPPALVEEIRDTLAELRGQSFAVRASRVTEDVPNPAASGLAQAELGIVGVDALLQAIRRCWASPWNSRAIYYRHRKKINPTQVTMAVVVQPMVDAEASGVMFTANPLTGAVDEIHVDATWGLGEAIIAARRKPDHFVVSKTDLVIKERGIADKSVMDLVSPDGGLQTVMLSSEKQTAPCLNDGMVVNLATLGKQVETLFKTVQDIEWCVVGDSIFLLQTRPLRKR